MEINHKGTFSAASTPQSSATPLPSRFLVCKPRADLLSLPFLSKKVWPSAGEESGFPKWNIKERRWTKTRISLYVEMNFPAIMRFKQCFLWNVVLGAKSQHNVLTPSTASANADRAPFSHIHTCGHKLRNMWVCGARRGRRRWIQKLLFLKKCFLFIKTRTVHGYPLPPHSGSWRWFTFDDNCELILWSKYIQAFYCHEESSVVELKKLRYLLYKGRNRFYLSLYSQHTAWDALYITRATNVYGVELKLYELVSDE